MCSGVDRGRRRKIIGGRKDGRGTHVDHRLTVCRRLNRPRSGRSFYKVFVRGVRSEPVRLLNGLSSRRRHRLTGGNRGRGLSTRVIVNNKQLLSNVPLNRGRATAIWRRPLSRRVLIAIVVGSTCYARNRSTKSRPPGSNLRRRGDTTILLLSFVVHATAIPRGPVKFSRVVERNTTSRPVPSISAFMCSGKKSKICR